MIEGFFLLAVLIYLWFALPYAVADGRWLWLLAGAAAGALAGLVFLGWGGTLSGAAVGALIHLVWSVSNPPRAWLDGGEEAIAARQACCCCKTCPRPAFRRRLNKKRGLKNV